MRRIGVLTSGGDSPGMNAAIMSVAKAARHYGMSLIGIKRGYNGTLCKSNHIEDDMVELDLDTILDIADQPGTYLRTARCLDFLRPEMRAHAVSNIHEMGIEGIVVIGGRRFLPRRAGVVSAGCAVRGHSRHDRQRPRLHGNDPWLRTPRSTPAWRTCAPFAPPAARMTGPA